MTLTIKLGQTKKNNKHHWKNILVSGPVLRAKVLQGAIVFKIAIFIWFFVMAFFIV